MLKALFGCKSIERILLFLLVNEQCYAHQLHRMLHIPLTPIQKALKRLEEGNIIKSQLTGKLRLYRFNQEYPLLLEIEMLLKKAFHQLAPGEKKNYYFLKHSPGSFKKHDQELLEIVWNHLKTMTRVMLIAKSRSPHASEWSRKGMGEVSVTKDQNSIIFHEQGKWLDEKQIQSYSNCFQWTLNRIENLISLEHLRHGVNRPVFLFHLAPTDNNLLESVHSHLCGEDTYFGWVHHSDLFLQLNFRIIGAKKNEEIEYIYT